VFQLAQVIEQLLCVVRDAQEPLLQIALLDDCVFVSPAASVNDLFIRKHRAALRAPVHLALFAISEAALEHADEEPLVPAVVIGQAGRDLVGPVVAQADAVHLPLHRGNI